MHGQLANRWHVIFFQDGKIAESGTHDELMDKKGLYYKLAVSQMRESNKNEDETNSQ